jgi:hypothetical protein
MNDTLMLVLTATITPSLGVTLARCDPNVRRSDYLRAFKYWLRHPDPRLRYILFAENSGANIAEFREAAECCEKEVEIISICPNPPPPGMHYGFSELQMIDRALSESRLRKQTTHMVKVTGRLVFPSLPKLLTRLPDHVELAIDCRARLPVLRPSSTGFASTQLFVAKHQFYDSNLRRSYELLSTRQGLYPHFMENMFFDQLLPLKEEKGVFLRFPVNCEPVGWAAHWDKQYNTPSRFLITTVRAVSRVITPKLWI